MSNAYREEIDNKCRKKEESLLATLPLFVHDYIAHINHKVTAQTKLGYLNDIVLFFEYVLDADTNYEHETIKDITLDCLNSLSTQFFDRYLNYLSFYEKDGKKRKNEHISLRRKLSSIRNFFSYLYLNNYIDNNNVQRVVQNSKRIVRMDPNSTFFVESVEMARD